MSVQLIGAEASHNGHFIIEDFLEKEDLSSGSESFFVNGELKYNGYYVNYIVHSNQNGVFKEAIINEDFRKNHVIEAEIRVKKGDRVETFKGANNAIGTLFLHFNSREEMEASINKQYEWLIIKVD